MKKFGAQKILLEGGKRHVHGPKEVYGRGQKNRPGKKRGAERKKTKVPEGSEGGGGGEEEKEREKHRKVKF